MSASFEERLNQVIDRLVSKELLSNAGLGNEIGFYIFDYEPTREIQMREFMSTINDQLPKRKPNIRFKHINLFELLIEYLQERKLLDRAFQLQKDKGDSELLRALKGPLNEKKVAQYFVKVAEPEEQDLVLMSGIGSSWPILRSHTLLNSLHPLMNETPLVIFYPGEFDGQGLRLFGKMKESNYYRAFRLVS
jgi:hypothetical protein